MGRKIAWVGEDFATFYELLAPSALDQRLHLARLNEAEGIKERPRSRATSSNTCKCAIAAAL